MLVDKILNEAESCLKGRKIKDIVIGLSILAVQLDNDEIGISYVLRDEIKKACALIPEHGEIIGMDAYLMANWAEKGKNVLTRALGVATLNAASTMQNNNYSKGDASLFADVNSSDTVGMIGHIGPMISAVKNKVKELIIFDKGKDIANVYPQEAQKDLLSTCDVVIITGSAIINNTIDDLLKMSENARKVILMGPSTPLYHKAYKDTRINLIAGSWWKKESKNEIFKLISLAGGIHAVAPYMKKVCFNI